MRLELPEIILLWVVGRINVEDQKLFLGRARDLLLRVNRFGIKISHKLTEKWARGCIYILWSKTQTKDSDTDHLSMITGIG